MYITFQLFHCGGRVCSCAFQTLVGYILWNWYISKPRKSQLSHAARSVSSRVTEGVASVRDDHGHASGHHLGITRSHHRLNIQWMEVEDIPSCQVVDQILWFQYLEGFNMCQPFKVVQDFFHRQYYTIAQYYVWNQMKSFNRKNKSRPTAFWRN